MVKKKSRAYILRKDIHRVLLSKSHDDFRKEMKRFGQLLERRDEYLQNKGEGLERCRLVLIEMDKTWEADTSHVANFDAALKEREDALVGCIEKWREELLKNEKAIHFVAELKEKLVEFNKWFESLAQPQSVEQILWLMGTESEYEHVADKSQRRLLLDSGDDGYDFTISKQDLFEYDANIYVVKTATC